MHSWLKSATPKAGDRDPVVRHGAGQNQRDPTEIPSGTRATLNALLGPPGSAGEVVVGSSIAPPPLRGTSSSQTDIPRRPPGGAVGPHDGAPRRRRRRRRCSRRLAGSFELVERGPPVRNLGWLFRYYFIFIDFYLISFFHFLPGLALDQRTWSHAAAAEMGAAGPATKITSARVAPGTSPWQT